MHVDRRNGWFFFLASGVLLASAGDILTDLNHGAPLMHMLQEGVILVLVAGTMLKLFQDMRHQATELSALKRQMREASATALHVNPALEGTRKRLSEAVNGQFDDWGLSPSEREVGWFLLKGLSIKEISAMRETKEKTVRQQASAIYAKADLPGRHAFAAWFIEDLL